ncbi:uncharacterized protein [Cicer arietinum]|uniref:uncharacterized protein n=1 Tax=Cicer arietinum TaxID=3827 RepID=UPI003CC68011
MIEGSIPVAIIYRVHYKAMFSAFTATKNIENKRGETLFLQTDLTKANTVIPKTILWKDIDLPEEWILEGAVRPQPLEQSKPNNNLKEVIQYNDDNPKEGPVAYSTAKIHKIIPPSEWGSNLYTPKQFPIDFKTTEKQLGREVTQAEIHRYLHVNPETNEYTDELSKNIQEQLQQIMKEWDDHQATLPPAQRAGPVQRKQYETASFMHISGGKYKGRVLGAGSLSSTFKKGPTGYIQTETSSSYASTDRSHRPSIDNDLDQLKKQWASEQEEKTQQLIQAAIDKLNEEWKQKFQEQQQQFQQQQQQFQQQQFSFPPVFHQQFPPRPQYLPQQPLFQQQQNYSQYSQQQQPPPNFQQQHQDPPNSAFQQVQQQPPMFQQQQYFHNYPYVPSSSHQIPQPQPDHQTAYRPTMPTAGLIRPDLNQPQPARAPHSTSGGAIEDEIQFQTMMSPPTQIHNTFEGLLSSGMAGNNDGVSGADQRNYYED